MGNAEPVSTFPFGRPVAAASPSAKGQRKLFVLGAYPSALHVRWQPPDDRLVRALAVDNEPEPFWTGHDQDAKVQSWKSLVGWNDRWGTVNSVDGLNGPSGQWVERNILEWMGDGRDAAWITDCLDTYRASVDMRRAMEA